MTVVAITAALLAGYLSLPGTARRLGQGRRLRSADRAPTVAALLAASLAVGALVGLAEGTALALGLVLVGAGLGGLRLVAAARRRQRAGARADVVLELCEALAGELRAGQPPVAALEHCAGLWPDFAPVATAGRLGADVPAALRELGERPGAGALRDLASAWQVSGSTGAGLSVALTQVATSVREQRATDRLVAAELASAQATARMVAALPAFSLVLGAGVGGDPWGFLLRTPAGLVCLACGLGLALLGLGWLERIAVGVRRR